MQMKDLEQLTLLSEDDDSAPRPILARARFGAPLRLAAGIAVATAVGTAVWHRAATSAHPRGAAPTGLATMTAFEEAAVTAPADAGGAKLEVFHSATIDGPPLAAGTSMRSDGEVVDDAEVVIIGGAQPVAGAEVEAAKPAEAAAAEAEPEAEGSKAAKPETKATEPAAAPAEAEPAPETPAQEEPKPEAQEKPAAPAETAESKAQEKPALPVEEEPKPEAQKQPAAPAVAQPAEAKVEKAKPEAPEKEPEEVGKAEEQAEAKAGEVQPAAQEPEKEAAAKAEEAAEEQPKATQPAAEAPAQQEQAKEQHDKATPAAKEASSGGYLPKPEPESKLEEVLAEDTQGWQCHQYQDDQDDEWCRSAGIIDKMEYKYTDADGECGFCHCCKKWIEKGSAAWKDIEEAMEPGAKSEEAEAESPEPGAKAPAEAATPTVAGGVRTMYSHEQAVAFAAFTKLAGCGTLPGIYAAVAATCSELDAPTASGFCKVVGFSIVPGRVLAFPLADGGSFYAAAMTPAADSGAEPGVLLAFSSEGHQEADKADRKLASEGAADQGHLADDTAAIEQVRLALSQLGCSPKRVGDTCTIHVTGRGPGAAMAQLIAWKLVKEDYKVGASYVFGSPSLGDAKFAKEMEGAFDGKKSGPIFNVVRSGGESEAKPAGGALKPWGFQAYYADDADKVEEICAAGDAACKSSAAESVCKLPFAHEGDLCEFKDKAAQCYGGMPV